MGARAGPAGAPGPGARAGAGREPPPAGPPLPRRRSRGRPGGGRGLLAGVLGALGALGAGAAGGGAEPDYGGVHVLFSTECTRYFDWQSTGLIHPHQAVYEQAGLPVPPITRLMACTEPDYPHARPLPYPFAHTHTHPPFNMQTEGEWRDVYSPYNKPGSLMHWLQHGNTTGTKWVVMIDADMILRKPWDLALLQPEPLKPVSAFYGYLNGANEGVFMGVKMHDVEKIRKGPYSKVGGFAIHHIDELHELTKLWLEYTIKVRRDPDSWASSGDIFTCPEEQNHPGCKGRECGCRRAPWISEMYGYVFASAVVGVEHKVNNKIMLYPDNNPGHDDRRYPIVLHYGLTYHVDMQATKGYSWAFDKHWYQSVDMLTCPGKLFPEPPTVDDIPEKSFGPTADAWYKQSLAVLNAQALHQGLREHHQLACGDGTMAAPQKQYSCSVNPGNFVLSCREMRGTPQELEAHRAAAKESASRGPAAAAGACVDKNDGCEDWAANGECEKNPGYMRPECAKSCGLCEGGAAGTAKPRVAAAKAEPKPKLADIYAKDAAGAGKATEAAARAMPAYGEREAGEKGGTAGTAGGDKASNGGKRADLVSSGADDAAEAFDALPEEEEEEEEGEGEGEPAGGAWNGYGDLFNGAEANVAVGAVVWLLMGRYLYLRFAKRRALKAAKVGRMK